MTRARYPLAAILSATLTAHLAFAKQAEPPSRFTLLAEHRPPSREAANGQFDVRTGAARALYHVNHPVAAAEPEVMARQYLRESAQRLGLDARSLGDLRLRASRAHPAGTTVRFDQTYKGVPVYGADLAVTIDNPRSRLS